MRNGLSKVAQSDHPDNGCWWGQSFRPSTSTTALPFLSSERWTLWWRASWCSPWPIAGACRRWLRGCTDGRAWSHRRARCCEASVAGARTCEKVLSRIKKLSRGGHHSSVDLSAPTILASCGPGFEFQAQHPRLFILVSNCILNLSLYCEKDENKQKRGRRWPVFKNPLAWWLCSGQHCS